MQDIDFEELDRAVSSALGTSGPITDVSPAPAPTPTAVVSPTPAPVSAPAPAPSPVVSTAPSVPFVASNAPAATPLRHASDIHTRQTVTPRAVDMPATIAQPDVAPTETVREAPSIVRRSTGRFMDVVHPSSDMRTAPVLAPRPSQTIVTPVTQPEPVATEPVEAPELPVFSFEPTVEADATPLETPFLSDAKVEKRPLGAFSAYDFEESPSAAPQALETVDPAADISEEVLIGTIESADTDPQAVETQPVAEEAPAPAAVVPAPTVDLSHLLQPTTTSIQQQYTEQPAAVAAEPTGAIFDTEAYHQPLAHPQKKKSGLSIILWIVGLIVFGAGLGAVLYFFVLPML